MAFSPFGHKAAISCKRIFALAGFALLVLQIVLAQKIRRPPADKGPRAVGLLEIKPNGKARLIPVIIMVGGKFYDASAYKAAPVPMALETGTVYEALRSGVSQGLFTVKGAASAGTSWRGEGTWESADAIKAAADRKKAMQVAEKAQAKREQEDQDAPPTLHRKNSNVGTASAPSPASAKSVPAVPPAPATAPPDSDNSAKSSASIPADDENDPDRPHLRRSKSEADESDNENSKLPSSAMPQAQGKNLKYGPTPVAAKGSVASSSVSSAVAQLIPAVSDAGGPEPRPYTFNLKPDEEVTLRNKMLALAAIEVRGYAKFLAGEKTTEPTPRTAVHKRVAAKPPSPTFDDIQLRVFDLSNSNEPVLVLTAKSTLPRQRGSSESPTQDNAPFLVTLVAREDIYGDLHKALANVTDSEHLGVLPRLDLIDAVDVDGDGRGELLFSRTSDVGSGYVVYRVIGNQLWPLFEGAIG